MINKTKYIWALIFLLSLSGCELFDSYKGTEAGITLDHPLADRSFLTGNPCKYPCWYGIELGKTSIEETLQILQQLNFVDQEAIKTREDVRVDYQCVYDLPGVFCGSVFFTGNIVNHLYYFVAYPLTLEDVIDIVGIPEYLYTDTVMQLDGCRLYLAWPERNLEIEYLNMNEEPCHSVEQGIGLNPNIQVTYIQYMAENRFNACSSEEIECFEWTGFEE